MHREWKTELRFGKNIIICLITILGSWTSSEIFPIVIQIILLKDLSDLFVATFMLLWQDLC